MHPIIQEYCRLVPFLAQVLGDHTEVLVHDLSNLDASVVAIANGHVSGRKVGSPMNENGLRLIRSRAHEREEMYIRYRGVSRKKTEAALLHQVYTGRGGRAHRDALPELRL